MGADILERLTYFNRGRCVHGLVVEALAHDLVAAVLVNRQSDRIPIKIKGVTFFIKPLSFGEKSKISSTITVSGGSQTENILDSMRLVLKYSVKDVKGLKYSNGEALQLMFLEDKTLTDDSIDELLSMEITGELNAALFQFLQGIPEKILDPVTGEVNENVKILPVNSVTSKKK